MDLKIGDRVMLRDRIQRWWIVNDVYRDTGRLELFSTWKHRGLGWCMYVGADQVTNHYTPRVHHDQRVDAGPRTL